MTVPIYNFSIPQGSTDERTFVLRNDDSENVQVDLRGYSARMQLRRFYSSKTPIDDLRSGTERLEIDTDRGEITVRFPSSITEKIPPGQYVYDLEITSFDQSTYRVVQGTIEFTPEVTRDE